MASRPPRPVPLVGAEFISANSVEKRLARALLLAANFNEEGLPDSVTLTISQQELADRIGSTGAQVTHHMNKFRKLYYVCFDGRTVEVRKTLLAAIASRTPTTER